MLSVARLVHVMAAVCVFGVDAVATWKQVLAKAPWGARAMPRGGVDSNGNFFVISGRQGALTLYGDTWRSPDGVTWTKMGDATDSWGKRAYPEVSILAGSLILTAGQGLSTFYNDVWRSDDDGRTWNQTLASAPWGERAGHFTFEMSVNGQETIMLFAGAKNSFGRVFYNDLWRSTDKGATWKGQILPQDMGRAGMQVVRVGSTLYFMGGDHDNPVFTPNWPGRRNDVWKSNDAGLSWECLGNATWSPRTGQQCRVLGDTIYCIGGEAAGADGTTPVLMHDVWAWDAKTLPMKWTLASSEAWGCASSAASCGRDDFLLVARDGSLWIFGGDEELSAPFPQDNDVWTFTP